MDVLREEVSGKGEVLVRPERLVLYSPPVFSCSCFLVFFPQRRIKWARTLIARQTASNAHSSFHGLFFACFRGYRQHLRRRSCS